MTCAEPGRFEIIYDRSQPTVYPEEVHDTVQVCVPLENARYGVVRRSETGRVLVHELGARDVLAVPAGQPHAVTWRHEADIVSLQLSEHFIAEALDVPRFHVPDAFTARDPFITAAAIGLRATLLSEGHVAPAFGEALATAIAYRIGVGSRNRVRRPGARARPLRPRELARVERFIDEHLDRPIGLAELAALAGLSKWHFLRCFEASRGVSPHLFIIERRLRRAQMLLAGRNLSITEIAVEVGMSPSYLSRRFARQFGVSPSAYRTLQRH